jgi:hypothetical protein
MPSKVLYNGFEAWLNKKLYILRNFYIIKKRELSLSIE